MSMWPTTTLGELIHVKHGYAFKGKFFAESGDKLVLKPGNFPVGGGIQLRPGKDVFYTGSFPPEFELSPGDMLMVMTDLTQAAPILGSPAVIPNGPVMLHNQRLGLVQIKPGVEVDRRFLYYVMLSDTSRSQIRATATGATVRHTAPERIYKVSVGLPDLSVQRVVGDLLGSIDDLIQNNRRRVEVLEDMARVIYREWFVKFRYPGHEDISFVQSAAGKLPVGWSLRTLAECCSLFVDGDWVETKDQGGSEFRLLQVSNIGLGSFRETGTYRYVTRETFDRLRCTAVKTGDLLISRMPDPVGRAWLVDSLEEPAITVVDVTLARPESRALGHYLSQVMNAQEQLAHAEAVATGTTRKRIARRVLGQLQVRVPPDELLERFHQTVEGNAFLVTRLRRENDQLSRLRDLLLPKLVTGQIDVSTLDLDALLAERAA